MTDEAPAALAMVTIDCADPAAEATFWAAALGWEVTYADDNYGMASDGTQRLGFGRIEGWQPPIRENLQALNFLGLEGGRSRSLTLVLAGRPAGGNWLTAPSGAEQEMWTEAVARLAPLRVDIFGASS